MTATEARQAYPEVKLGTIPFMLFDVFEGNEPTPDAIASRLTDPPPPWRNSTAGLMKILDRPELFDYVDIHSLGDYTEIPPTLRWFRSQMQERGYEKPIWIDDAFAVSYLATFHPAPNIGWPATYPVSEETHGTVYDLLGDVALLEEPAYSEAVAWIRTQTASGAVKKAVTALGEGALGIQIGNLEDWMLDSAPPIRRTQINLIGAAGMMGMIDVSHPQGYQIDRVRAPGEGASSVP